MPIAEFKFRVMMTLCVFGLSTSVIVLIRAFAARLLTLRWQRTEAHVLDVRDTVWVVPGPVSRAATGIRAHYMYLVGGKRYESRRISPYDTFGAFFPRGDHYLDVAQDLRRAMDEGTSIAVYYDPSRPQSAYVTRTLSIPVTLSWLLALVFFAAMIKFLPALRDFDMRVHAHRHSAVRHPGGRTAPDAQPHDLQPATVSP